MRKRAQATIQRRTNKGGKHRRGPGLSIEEAAAKLNLPPTVVQAMVTSGELASRRFGRYVRVPERAVTDLIAAFGEPLHHDRGQE